MWPFSSSGFLFWCCKLLLSDQRLVVCRNSNLQVEGGGERKDQSTTGAAAVLFGCCGTLCLSPEFQRQALLQLWVFFFFSCWQNLWRGNMYVWVLTVLKLTERDCLDITARWEIRPGVSASKVLAAGYKRTSGKQVEINGFCSQGQKRKSFAGLWPVGLEQRRLETHP